MEGNVIDDPSFLLDEPKGVGTPSFPGLLGRETKVFEGRRNRLEIPGPPPTLRNSRPVGDGCPGTILEPGRPRALPLEESFFIHQTHAHPSPAGFRSPPPVLPSAPRLPWALRGTRRSLGGGGARSEGNTSGREEGFGPLPAVRRACPPSPPPARPSPCRAPRPYGP